MLQNSILEKFIRNRLKDKLYLFFELQQSIIEGLTIRNLGIKPDLLHELSQIIKVPLILTSGSIESVSLNIPWESLLTAKKDQAIAVVISGIKISAKLPNDLQKEYILLRKKKIVERFTQEFNKKATSRLTFINKLKQYFFGTFCIEVKNIELEVSIQMKHSLVGQLMISYLKFQKDIKTNKTKFQISHVSLGYRLAKQTKTQYIINKADLQFTGDKTNDADIDHLETNNLFISFNNENFNDIRRIVTLVKWHNSFVNLPRQLWAVKPSIIGDMSPKKKLIYVASIIKYRTSENSGKKVKKILEKRREYLRVFQNFRRDPNDVVNKNKLNSLDEEMEVWRIQQYRKFCLLWAKKFPNTPHSRAVGKKQAVDGKVGWLSYWFPKSGQIELKQLQQCLDNTPTRIAKKYFTVSIQQIKITISIRSLSGKEAFLNLLSYNNEIEMTRIPVSQEKKLMESEIQYEKNTKIIINKMMVEYDKYVGHHQDHLYLMAELLQKSDQANNNAHEGDISGSQSDQFEDIENFLECHISAQQTDIKIQPVVIRLNEETIEKLSVYKFERIHNTFENAEKLILEQNTFEEATKKQGRELNLKTSVYVKIPQNMYEKQTEQIDLALVNIEYSMSQAEDRLSIEQVNLSAVLNMSNSKEESSSTHSEKGQEEHTLHYETIELVRTRVTMKKEQHQSIEQIEWNINAIKINFTSIFHLKQLIRLASKLKPKQNSKKPLYKLKNLRRKQSIGEEFIDACENLNEHLLRSATLSQRTRHEKYIIKEKKDKKIQIKFQGIKAIFETSEIELSQSSINIFEFNDYRSITIDMEEKELYIRVYNIKNSIKNLIEINKELERMLELKISKDLLKAEKNEVELEGDTFVLNNFSIFVEVYYGQKLKISAEVCNLWFEVQRDRNIKMEFTMGLAYHQYPHHSQKNKLNNRNQAHEQQKEQRKPIKQYVIQSFKVSYLHEKKYNKDEKSIKVSSININIKPNLLLELGALFDELNTPEKLRIEIVNSTANTIQLSTTGNLYKQYKPNHIAISSSINCDIIIFGRKEVLTLSPEAGTQEIKLTDKLSLIKTLNTQYIYQIQSNVRFTNRQHHTVWVRVITSQAMTEMRKNSMRDNGLITFQHLSHAQMDNEMGEDHFKGLERKGNMLNNLKRSSSLNQRTINQSEDSESIKDDEQHEIDKINIQMKKVNITRTLEATKNKDDSMKQSPRKSQKLEKSGEVPIAKLGSNKSTAESRKESQHEILYQAIAPQHTIQILLSSEDHYIEILEYDARGEVHERYQPFKIKQALKDNNQLLVHSYIFDTWANNEDEMEISSSLIVATNMCSLCESNPIQIYNIQILSPIVMVNKIPTSLEFRFNKQEVDMLQIINSAGRSIRKRSFQVVELNKIQSFNICRINKMQFKEISETEIRIREYSKNFRLDHIVEKIKQRQENVNIRIVDLLCLNNGQHEIQMGIEIRILKYIMKITIFPQFIFINMTQLPIKLQIKEENYTYPQIQLNPLSNPKDAKLKTNYKHYIKASNDRLSNSKILQQLFQQFEANIDIFTGSFDQDIVRSIRYGNGQSYAFSSLYSTYELAKNNANSRQKEIVYDNSIKLVLRKINIDDKPINMVIFMPSLYIINKSDWGFFIKGGGENEKLKKIQKNSTEYLVINDSIAIQACEESEEIAYNQWMKITLTTLGTIHYAKQMGASNGYESREYELRKKRLKKVPKLFFRIVMAKYEYGYQILIEQSQYPPVSFISRCKSRIQVRQTTQNIVQEMEYNQMAEYASKTSHHIPKFAVSLVEHYQFKDYGEFDLQEAQKILSNRIKITVEEYKDKQIVILEDYDKDDRSKYQSIIRNQLLLEKLERIVVSVNNIEISILTKFNKELSCACLRGLEIQHQSKNTKKYIKVSMDDLEIFSYNGLQPKYLFYSKMPTNAGISRKEVLGLFKRKGMMQVPQLQQSQVSGSFYMNQINKSIISSGSDKANPSSPIIHQILSLDIVIDYHKHATILQKCKVTISQLVIVINANTLIDYLKYYYREICQLLDLLKKHELGRKLLSQIEGIFISKKSNSDENREHNDMQDSKAVARKDSVTINNINNTLMKKNTSNKSTEHPSRKSNRYHHEQAPPVPSDGSIMERGFIIENFVWDGLKVAFKFQNLDNLHYFMTNKEIKYLIKFITWVGDLRPIEFSPTLVQYQKYTILKLIELIDLNKLIRQLYQTFLQYPLQQLYHIMSFITRFIGVNQQEQSGEQWRTFKRLGKSILNITKKIFTSSNNTVTYTVNENGDLVENKFYLDQFMEDNANNHSLMDKIMGFKYEEWRYNQEVRQNKLNIKALRLERYSPASSLLPYESSRSRIQTAINDHCGNKVFRQINHITFVNKDTIIGLTEDWFVLYSIEKEEWIVARPEDVLNLHIEKARNKTKSVFNVGSEKQLVVTLVMYKEKNEESGKIEKYIFSELTASKSDIQAIEDNLASMRLSGVY